MIRIMFALCFLAAGCGAGEEPSPPPRGDTQGQEPSSRPLDLGDYDFPRPDFCFGEIRHGPILVDRENIDEVRSLTRLYDLVSAFPPTGPDRPIQCLIREAGIEVDFSGNCDFSCPRPDIDCVNVYRGQLFVGMLDVREFRDIFTLRFWQDGPYRLDFSGLFRAAAIARDVETRCF